MKESEEIRKELDNIGLSAEKIAQNLKELLTSKTDESIDEIKRAYKSFKTSVRKPDDKNMEVAEIVRDLNIELAEKYEEFELGFEYSSNGFAEVISFNGAFIWSTDMDEREWIEEKNDYEPLEPFIKKLFKEYVEKLQKLEL